MNDHGEIEDKVPICYWDQRRFRYRSRCVNRNDVSDYEGNFEHCGCCDSHRPKYCKYEESECGPSPDCEERRGRVNSCICYKEQGDNEGIDLCVDPFLEVPLDPGASYSCGACSSQEDPPAVARTPSASPSSAPTPIDSSAPSSMPSSSPSGSPPGTPSAEPSAQPTADTCSETEVCGFVKNDAGEVEEKVPICYYDNSWGGVRTTCVARSDIESKVQPEDHFIGCGCCPRNLQYNLPKYCYNDEPQCSGSLECETRRGQLKSLICYEDASEGESYEKCVNPFRSVSVGYRDSYTCGSCDDGLLSSAPSAIPSPAPSALPSLEPSSIPSTSLTTAPTESSQPSSQPSSEPSTRPSLRPTSMPSSKPSGQPSSQPSEKPTSEPSGQPSSQPSPNPSSKPSTHPSTAPSKSSEPSLMPSSMPTLSNQPSSKPSSMPSVSNVPSLSSHPTPSINPTPTSSSQPSGMPSFKPSTEPSSSPTSEPSQVPSGFPSSEPSLTPSSEPSQQSLSSPSTEPSSSPTSEPSQVPSRFPSSEPSLMPSPDPSQQPSSQPSTVSSPIVYGLQPDCFTNDPNRYNICLDLFDESGTTQPWMEAFRDARNRWEGVITGDDGTPISTSSLDTQYVATGYPPQIDDLYIAGNLTAIDGPSNVLGFAGPVYVKFVTIGSTTYTHPVTGIMSFDVADFGDEISDGAAWLNVILHEMGHALGIGTLWDDNNAHNQACTNGQYNDNTIAQQKWEDLGCTGRLPVETNGNCPGTAGGHWDEECLNSELMTGFRENSGDMPLSTITIGSLEDMGYVVDYSVADPFDIGDLDAAQCTASCPEAASVSNIFGNRRNLEPATAKMSDGMRAKMTLYAAKQMAGMRTNRPSELPTAISHVGGDVLTVYFKEDGHLFDLTVTWNEAKHLVEDQDSNIFV